MKIEYEYQSGMQTDSSYHRKYIHQPTGIEKEIFTKRKNGRPFGNGEVSFYHKDDKEIHESFLEALQNAVLLGLVTKEQATPFNAA